MVRQARRDTKPELALRRALHARGWRYRVDRPPMSTMRRRADIVFPRRRVAVFVDGCFWHSCPEHGSTPKNNRDWWVDKLAKNVERDRSTDRMLADEGWSVVRVWKHSPTETAVATVEAVLTSGSVQSN